MRTWIWVDAYSYLTAVKRLENQQANCQALSKHLSRPQIGMPIWATSSTTKLTSGPRLPPAQPITDLCRPASPDAASPWPRCPAARPASAGAGRRPSRVRMTSPAGGVTSAGGRPAAGATPSGTATSPTGRLSRLSERGQSEVDGLQSRWWYSALLQRKMNCTPWNASN